MDAYLGILVVDGGLLLHICKLKHVIANHPLLSPDREQKYTTMLRSPFFHTTNLLLMLARYSMHRPVAVRVLRSMRKIESLGLDSWDSVDDGGRGYFKRIQAAWQSLKHEATQRVSEGDIYWSADAKEFCANANCTNTQVYGVCAFVRCSGCKSSVYCSYECQKEDWRLTHKKTCQSTQSHMRDGLYFRLPGLLDVSLLQSSFVRDFERNDLRTKAKAAFKAFVAKHGVEPMIWVDYRRPGPAEADVFSVEESRKKRNEFGNGEPIVIDETERVFWRMQLYLSEG
ncbi:hypothetical protein AAF712_004593 [Marasmius tenuissimus]|uniref:MYND-type domain-containing protein n=1 Tax=Marasmius tenuissimus TaxID=585030 RepID=A0ABR3A5D4_9AGAR